MICADDECKINGLHVAELTYTRLQSATGRPKVEIAYALVQTNTEKTEILNTQGKVAAYGNNLSKRSWELIDELLKSIEQDLLPRHFKAENKERTDADTSRTATTELEEEANQF